MEKWEWVKDSERYRVSTEGRVWDCERDVEVSRVVTGPSYGKYYYVNLQLPQGRKLVKCSRLVAEAFIPNPENLPVVDHIDRDKFNDRLENLRWVTYSGNSLNRDDNILVEWQGEEVHLVTIIRDIFEEDYLKAYSSVVKQLSNGLSFKEALERFQNPEDYTNHNKVVEYEGKEVRLYDLVVGKSSSYDTVMSRLNAGWDVWSSIYGCPPIPDTCVTIRQEDGTRLCFSGKRAISEESGRSRDVVVQALDNDWTYQHLLTYEYDGRQLYEINGVSGTREYWYKVYNTTETRVKARMTRRGITFEEALQLPKERVSSVILNGEKMSVRSMWESFGLNHKNANNYKRNMPNRTFKDVLLYYGVDVRDLNIEEV